jgi:hypothetical protein
LSIAQCHIPPLAGQKRLNKLVLRLGKFHGRSIPHVPFSVNTP